jgi:hypothetical protein
VIIIDRIHALCSKLWQYILSFLFSDQGPNENNNIFLQYFPQDSLWLNQYSLSTINSNVNSSIRPMIDFERLPIWRFTIRRRRQQTTHGASEYHSDIELEQDSRLKKSSFHRHMINQQDNSYTSESDENNNSLNSNLNSSEIYQCSICLEKYFHHVYICTLPCLHHFHRKCLFDWLRNSEHNTCPLCRSPVMN